MYNPTTGRAKTIDSLLSGADATTWKTLLTNKIGLCSQRVSKQIFPADKIDGYQTIFFIHPNQVLVGRKVTYANLFYTMHPNKAEVHRIRMTVGGDKLDSYQDVFSPIVITNNNIHLNRTISYVHRGARYCTGDPKYFSLNSKIHIYQYMCLHRRYIKK